MFQKESCTCEGPGVPMSSSYLRNTKEADMDRAERLRSGAVGVEGGDAGRAT